MSKDTNHNLYNGWFYNEFGCLRHYVNNKCHNDKAPAFIGDKGSKFWYQNNKYHRLDGPAQEFSSGKKYWFYYQGKKIDCQSQQEFERIIKLRSLW